ncbi:MAG: hypothetical protein U0821_27060 [Chloroflexota bacterium]
MAFPVKVSSMALIMVCAGFVNQRSPQRRERTRGTGSVMLVRVVGLVVMIAARLVVGVRRVVLARDCVRRRGARREDECESEQEQPGSESGYGK